VYHAEEGRKGKEEEALTAESSRSRSLAKGIACTNLSPRSLGWGRPWIPAGGTIHSAFARSPPGETASTGPWRRRLVRWASRCSFEPDRAPLGQDDDAHEDEGWAGREEGCTRDREPVGVRGVRSGHHVEEEAPRLPKLTPMIPPPTLVRMGMSFGVTRATKGSSFCAPKKVSRKPDFQRAPRARPSLTDRQDLGGAISLQ
jgi:hypothetical protein